MLNSQTDLNENFYYWWEVIKKRVDPNFSFSAALNLVNKQMVKAGWRKWQDENLYLPSKPPGH